MFKPKNFSSNIRIRILILTLFTITPVIFLVVYFNLIQLRRAHQLQVSHLQNIAQLVAAENIQIIEGARQLLLSLSTVQQLNGTIQDCNKYLSSLLKKYQRYSNFAVADFKGNVFCSALGSQAPLNVSGRYSFSQALATGDFAVGEYIISPTTNRSSLNFGYPLKNPTRVIYATLDLDWLNQLVTTFQIDDQMTLLMLDRQGIILAQNPSTDNTIGNVFSSNPPVHPLPAETGVLETTDTSNKKSVFAYQQMGDHPDAPVVLVGLPEAVILNQPLIDFKNSLALSGLVAFSSIIFSWYMGNSLITRTVMALSKVEELKRDFVSLVSHQIRTPLTGIKYFVEILLSQKSGKTNTQQAEFLSDIKESANRLSILVNTLLDVSRLESGKIVPVKNAVNLNTIIKEAVRELKTLFQQKKVTLKLPASSHLRIVQADSKLISQVISNLLTNAANYSHPNSRIEILLSQSKHDFQLEVKNYGIGIAEESQPHIFSKFYRSADAKRTYGEGSGLGLHLSRLIIEAHGGKIWFQTSNKYTSFFFTLPR